MPPGNTNNFFGIKVSKSGIPVNQASDKQLIYKDDFSTKTYFDLTNSRMLEGKLPDGSYGLWVSAPGVDVTTADPTVAGQLSFNSSNQTFQILTSGTTLIPTQTLGASAFIIDNVAIPHNLGFPPIVQAYISTNVAISLSSSVASYVPLPVSNIFLLPSIPSSGALTIFNIYATADSQNVYFSWAYGADVSGAVVPSLPVQYYLINVSPA